MRKRERGKGRGKREGLRWGRGREGRVKVGGNGGGLRWEERGMAEGRVKASMPTGFFIWGYMYPFTFIFGGAMYPLTLHLEVQRK